MSLFDALDSSAGSAVYTWWHDGSCSVEEQLNGTYLIAATKLEDGTNPRRHYEQVVADWETLVLRVAAFPFACDPVAGWSPAFPV